MSEKSPVANLVVVDVNRNKLSLSDVPISNDKELFPVFPFMYLMNIIVPCLKDREFLMELTTSLQEEVKGYPSLFLNRISLSFFFHPDVANFLFRKNQCEFSSQLSFCDEYTDSNSLAILSCGEIFFLVDIDTYQRLGLAGFEVKQYRPKDNSRRLLKFDIFRLLEESKTFPSKTVQRLQWAFQPPQLDLVCLNGYFQAGLNDSGEAFLNQLKDLLNHYAFHEASATLKPIEVMLFRYSGEEGYAFRTFQSNFPVTLVPDVHLLRNELFDATPCHLQGTVEELLEYTGKLILNIETKEEDYSWATLSPYSLACITIRTQTNALLGSAVAQVILQHLMRKFSSQCQLVSCEFDQPYPFGWITMCAGASHPVQLASVVGSGKNHLTHRNGFLRKIGQNLNLSIKHDNTLDQFIYLYGELAPTHISQDTLDTLISIHLR